MAYLNVKYHLKILKSTLTKRKREKKHENSEHRFEVGTLFHIFFTYYEPSSEDEPGQFFRFVECRFDKPLSEVRRGLNANKHF